MTSLIQVDAVTEQEASSFKGLVKTVEVIPAPTDDRYITDLEKILEILDIEKGKGSTPNAPFEMNQSVGLINNLRYLQVDRNSPEIDISPYDRSIGNVVGIERNSETKEILGYTVLTLSGDKTLKRPSELIDLKKVGRLTNEGKTLVFNPEVLRGFVNKKSTFEENVSIRRGLIKDILTIGVVQFLANLENFKSLIMDFPRMHRTHGFHEKASKALRDNSDRIMEAILGKNEGIDLSKLTPDCIVCRIRVGDQKFAENRQWLRFKGYSNSEGESTKLAIFTNLHLKLSLNGTFNFVEIILGNGRPWQESFEPPLHVIGFVGEESDIIDKLTQEAAKLKEARLIFTSILHFALREKLGIAPEVTIE